MEVKNAERFMLVEYADAANDVKAIYDETMQTLQLPFVLNWFKCQGNNATLLHGNWTKLKTTLLQGNVPNILKQLIIYRVSELRQCDYCATAHKIFADSMSSQLSNDPAFRVTDNLDAPELPESYKIALRVVTKAALNTAELSDEDFDELAYGGFTDEEIQELMAQADLVNMLNTIATISGIKIDNELVTAAA